MNYQIIKSIAQQQNIKLIDIKVGQYVEIHEDMSTEKAKRIWKFRGLVIKVKKPNNPDGTFTVRGESAGVKIEKIYPFSFNKFEKIELLDEYKIRKSKLYYTRYKVGKSAKMKSVLPKEQKNQNLSYRDI